MNQSPGKVFAVITSVAVLVSLTACGQGETLESAASSPVSSEVDALATRIYARIGGSGAERSAEMLLTNYRLNKPTQDCMAKLGVQFTINLQNKWTNWRPTSGLSGNGFLAAPVARPVSTVLLANAPFAKALRESLFADPNGDSEQPGYDQAYALCDQAGKRPQEAVPPRAEELLGEFHGLVDSVDARVGRYADDYETCMSDHGWSGIRGYDDLMTELGTRAPDDLDEIPAAGEDGSEAWKTFLAQESAAVVADGVCRADAYEEGSALLLPALRTFAEQHAAELDSVDASWREVVTKAKAIGWDPTQITQEFTP